MSPVPPACQSKLDCIAPWRVEKGIDHLLRVITRDQIIQFFSKQRCPITAWSLRMDKKIPATLCGYFSYSISLAADSI